MPASQATSVPRPAETGVLRALRWPKTMQLGLAFLLGIVVLLLAQHAWRRVASTGHATLVLESTTNANSSLYRIDLNRASAADLQQLPGIGPKRADRIVAYREQHGPYQRLEDLEQVDGIGPKIVDRIRGRVEITRLATAPVDHRESLLVKGATTSPGLPTRPLDLNRASAEELAQLPGIGPVLADRIVADRRERGQFQRVSDITRISRIKTKTLEKLLPYVYVGGERTATAAGGG